MLTELLLISAVGIYDPMDMREHKMYPSGVKEADKYPRYALPASDLAKLSLPRNILAKDGRTIKSGHYLIGLSVSKNTILFFDGENNLFELSISNSQILNKTIKLSTANFYASNDGTAYVSLKQGRLHVISNVIISDY